MTFSPLDPIPVIAAAWLHEGRSIAIATVIRTWGSSPRPVGAQMVVDATGAMMGSVSGGCVESEVIASAMDAISDQKRRVLDFDVADDNAFAAGLACGGKVSILIEPVGGVLKPELIEGLAQAITQREPIAMRSALGENTPAEGFTPDIGQRTGISEDGQAFVLVLDPPIRVVIVGAVHIAQALVPLVQLLDMVPIVIDPRLQFASADRFENINLIAAWPDEAMAEIGLDNKTAVVTLSHDPKIDDPALISALRSDVFYIGSLGSTRTHTQRVGRLEAHGFDDLALARIHGPVGLAIGAKTPSEIATSIAAQIVQCVRQGN